MIDSAKALNKNHSFSRRGSLPHRYAYNLSFCLWQWEHLNRLFFGQSSCCKQRKICSANVWTPNPTGFMLGGGIVKSFVDYSSTATAVPPFLTREGKLKHSSCLHRWGCLNLFVLGRSKPLPYHVRYNLSFCPQRWCFGFHHSR